LPARSADAAPVQKQRFNVYTMMLVLSFIAICTACTLLWLELESYAGENESAIGVWNGAKAARFTPPPPTTP
jgi:hypothetical protein